MPSTSGARTLDGIKFRTRAGMGRCQGGFCSWRSMQLLSAELGIPITEVTKRGGKSWVVCERSEGGDAVITAEPRHLKSGYDVVIVGAGPAGMAAAVGARARGAEKILLIDREHEAGGILWQCIHHGFGLTHFGKRADRAGIRPALRAARLSTTTLTS